MVRFMGRYILLLSVSILCGCNFYIPNQIDINVHQDPPVDKPEPPPKDVSFKDLQQSIFQPQCLKCHGGASPRANFSVETYAQAIKGVEKNDAKNSLIYDRPCIEKDMPPSGGQVSQDNCAAIRTWIEQGAKE